MKKIFLWILPIFVILIIAFPFSEVQATGAGENTQNQGGNVQGTGHKKDISEITEKDAKDLRTDNFFEMVISTFGLDMGDYAHDYISQVFREEITIDKLVYNKATLTNANFFENSTNPSNSNATKAIRTVINKWYDAFRSIALVICMASLVVAGLKIILNTPEGKVKAMDILKKVILGVALAFMFPYVMLMAFKLNEAIVNEVYSTFHTYDSVVGIAISQVSDIKPDDLEFRSPDYVSKRSLIVSAGSYEATQAYLSRLDHYAKSADIMRIMRAFAGVTLRFLYVMIWYIMLVQLYMLAFVYLKRYITIAFLIAIYPLTIIGYVSDGLMGHSQTAFNLWCKTFFTNVFLQSIHAITYGVICSVLMSQTRQAIVESKFASINWILMVIATSFLFTGEKILMRLWNAATGPESRDGLKSALGAPKRMLGALKGK